MLIDNLHRINSAADLFQYICEIETKLAEAEAKTEELACRSKVFKKGLADFLHKYGWEVVTESTPMPKYDVEVYIIKDGDATTARFTEAVYTKADAWALPECYNSWQVVYWRYIPESDLMKAVSAEEV